jgi:hypothetical protein
VIFPGWFSTAAGPDYRKAVIADLDGNLRRGAVEIHVEERAWRDHGHDRDNAYNDVILHVVLRRGSEHTTITAAGTEVPVVELGSMLCRPLSELRLAFQGWRPRVVQCPVHAGNPSDLAHSIADGGKRRFEGKVRRITADVEAVGADEALYRLLAESLGYSANRAQFRELAEAIPFSLLASLSALQAEHLLLAAAGISRDDRLLTPYLDGPVLKEDELVSFRVRPANSPTARLRGLARLVVTQRHGLAAAMKNVPPRDLWKLFVVEADSVLVGRSRANDIVLNVAIPYLTAYHDLDGVAALNALPAPADNRWVTALRGRLTAAGVILKPYRALQQQGLLDLSLRFCRYDHCEACPLHAVT